MNTWELTEKTGCLCECSWLNKEANQVLQQPSQFSAPYELCTAFVTSITWLNSQNQIPVKMGEDTVQTGM